MNRKLWRMYVRIQNKLEQIKNRKKSSIQLDVKSSKHITRR